MSTSQAGGPPETPQGPLLWVGGNGSPAEVREVMAHAQVILQCGERLVAAQEAGLRAVSIFLCQKRANRACSRSGDLSKGETEESGGQDGYRNKS